MRRTIIFLYCLVIIAAIGCKEPYEPRIISSSDSHLVVEGILNAGQGPTTISLSRTYKLDDTARIQYENNAQVIVEGKDNTARQLTMNGNGAYFSPGLNLTINQEYRLRIRTANGKEYLSDYVVARATPAIDSLEFEQNEKGVQVYVNTHDNSDNTRYYLWNYDETWEIHTYFYSNFKYENGIVLPRTPSESISTCWKYGFSTNIFLGSSASLQSDIIRKAPLNLIPNGDERLAVRYSILLRQYALDKSSYQFYEMMKKNTESPGTIFDPQPSEIKGNIHCTSNPGELVIGYITASEITEKRFFISKDQLQGWFFFQDCEQQDIPNNPDSISAAYAMGLQIFDALYMPFIVRYYVAGAPCVDCTRRGGSLIRPSYW